LKCLRIIKSGFINTYDISSPAPYLSKSVEIKDFSNKLICPWKEQAPKIVPELAILNHRVAKKLNPRSQYS
jgi:hypothetical protein